MPPPYTDTPDLLARANAYLATSAGLPAAGDARRLVADLAAALGRAASPPRPSWLRRVADRIWADALAGNDAGLKHAASRIHAMAAALERRDDPLSPRRA